MIRFLMGVTTLWLCAITEAATIQLTAQFNGVTPERLYQAYLDSEEHTAFTGAPAKIEAKEGGHYSVFAGGITGKIYQLVPNRLIVQSWRGAHFKPKDLDSTLVLSFRKNELGAEIELVQTNIPDEIRLLVNRSWNLRYWDPLRKYLACENNS